MWTRNCERIASGLGTRKPLGRIFIFIFIFIFWAGSIVFFFATAFPFPGRLFFLPEFFCFRFGFRDWKVLGTRFFLGGRGSLYGTPLWKQKRNKTQSLTWSRIHWQRRKYVEPVSFFFFFFFFFWTSSLIWSLFFYGPMANIDDSASFLIGRLSRFFKPNLKLSGRRPFFVERNGNGWNWQWNNNNNEKKNSVKGWELEAVPSVEPVSLISTRTFSGNGPLKVENERSKKYHFNQIELDLL